MWNAVYIDGASPEIGGHSSTGELGRTPAARARQLPNVRCRRASPLVLRTWCVDVVSRLGSWVGFEPSESLDNIYVMYVCIYIYIFMLSYYVIYYVCIYIYMYRHVNIYIYICMYIYVYIYKYVCIYIYIYVCIYMYMYIYICTYIYIHICLHRQYQYNTYKNIIDDLCSIKVSLGQFADQFSKHLGITNCVKTNGRLHTRAAPSSLAAAIKHKSHETFMQPWQCILQHQVHIHAVTTLWLLTYIVPWCTLPWCVVAWRITAWCILADALLCDALMCDVLLRDVLFCDV